MTADMTVESIMTRDLVTIAPDTTLSEIRTLLREHGFRHLLVVDESGNLCGILSDRDVLQATSPFLDTHTEEYRDVRTLCQPAKECMSSDPVVVRSHAAVPNAIRLLLHHNISALPVVDDGEFVGIVTIRDMLRHYAEYARAKR